MPNLDDASDFLVALLSCGPVAVAEVRARAEAAGHSWRTIERARGLIGARLQSVWTRPDAIGGSPAKLADRPPSAPPHNVVPFERPRAEAKPKPTPKPTKERTRYGPPVAKVWAGGAPLVRCAECLHRTEIQDHGDCGFCPVGELAVRYSYGRRHCDAYQPDPAREPEAPAIRH